VHNLIIVMLVMRYDAIIGLCVTDLYHIIKAQVADTMVDINMTIIVDDIIQIIAVDTINSLKANIKKTQLGSFLLIVSTESSIFYLK
jgi:hypothetical protein